MSRKAPCVIVHNDVPGVMAARLREAVPEAQVIECDSYEEMEKLLPEAKPDVVYSVRFGGTYGYPREVMLGKHGPGWISVGGSGCDHLGQWNPDKVTVTNSAGVAAAMMAEYAFGCALHFTLGIKGLQHDKAAHRWDPRPVVPLRGKTILIVGLGQTGQAVAERARAFGMNVLGTRARPEPMENVDEVFPAQALPELWGRADMIVVSVPLLDTTRGLINTASFAAMKPSAILIDVSRGGVIDGAALLDALQNSRIAGAALDVFEMEPLPEDSPFWEVEKAIISPHSSSVYEGWDMASFELFLENLARWQRGETLHNIVNPVRGY